MYSLGQQISELVVSLGLGMLVALLLQVYQAALLRIKVARWYAWSWDLIFWLIAVSIVFTTLLGINGGEVRAHILLSLLMGAVIYRVYFYRRLAKATGKVSTPLALTLRSIYQLLTWPGRWRQHGKPDSEANADKNLEEEWKE